MNINVYDTHYEAIFFANERQYLKFLLGEQKFSRISLWKYNLYTYPKIQKQLFQTIQKLSTYLTLSFNGIWTKYHKLWYYYKDTEAA
jgi:hypothetical protein